MGSGVKRFVAVCIFFVLPIVQGRRSLLIQPDDNGPSGTPVTKNNWDDVRVLTLKGQDEFFCRLWEGMKTFPRLWYRNFEMATRTYLMMRNLQLNRYVPVEGEIPKLDNMMVGPLDYFGSLSDAQNYSYKIHINNEGIPQFRQYLEKNDKETKTTKVSEYEYTVEAEWISGKQNREKLQDYGEGFVDGSLFASPGVLKIKGALKDPITLNWILLEEKDERSILNLDLSPFGAELVKNDKKFEIPTKTKSEKLSVSTYWYGKDYVKNTVYKSVGLFLEYHDFTQIMTPLHEDAQAFMLLGRVEDDEPAKRSQGSLDGNVVLKLIGVRIPFGYSIVVHKGCIHGDSLFRGMYAMSMTTDHNLMNTADTVFLKSDGKDSKNIEINIPPQADEQAILKIPEKLLPLVPNVQLQAGVVQTEKDVFDIIRQIPSSWTNKLTRVVFNPTSKLYRKYIENYATVG